MELIFIPLVACGASLLTFFSGFGLGTLLTPVFAVVFPIEQAVSMTAIVHFLNGLFKFVLVGRHLEKNVLLRFGLPALLSALLGAWLLIQLTGVPPLLSYTLFGHSFLILPIKLIMAILIMGFTLFEIIPSLQQLQFDKKFLPIGGLLSGFFGGLSGHQGALRSAFLSRSGLTKEQFIATGVAISVIIDISRLIIYSSFILYASIMAHQQLLIFSTLAAFLGAYLGSLCLKKITLRGLQKVVSLSLFLLALALGVGII